MSLLLDTHAFLWWLDGDGRLSPRARSEIGNESARVYVSAASAWEIATKHRRGKLPDAADVARDVLGCIRSQRFEPLPIDVSHAQIAGQLPGGHKDPFDRMLAAQAQAMGLAIVSIDEVHDSWGVPRIW